MQTNNGQQMSLLAFGGIESKVFLQNPIKNSKGIDVGFSVKIDSRKNIAERYNLKGKANKDELDEQILKQRDDFWRQARSLVAGLNGDWTGQGMYVRTNPTTGIRTLVIKAQEIKRGKVITDEQIAKAWGIPLEAVAEFRAKNARIGSPVDVEQVPAGPATVPAIPAKK